MNSGYTWYPLQGYSLRHNVYRGTPPLSLLVVTTVTTEQVPGLEALCTCSGEVTIGLGVGMLILVE